jgi:hypothetical protein
MGMLGNGWTVDVIAHIFSFLKVGKFLIIFLTKMLIRSTIVGRFQVSIAIFWYLNLPFYFPYFCTKF